MARSIDHLDASSDDDDLTPLLGRGRTLANTAIRLVRKIRENLGEGPESSETIREGFRALKAKTADRLGKSAVQQPDSTETHSQENN